MTTPTRAPLPAPPPSVGTLGCAHRYQAAIHFRGGERAFIPASRLADTVTEVSWERRLNETSGARVTLAKRQLDPACCADLGDTDPWCHELSVYRDSDLVWQGPIIRVTEEETQFTIEAQDITAWYARLVNTKPTNFTNMDPGWIASVIALSNLSGPLSAPTNDWPNILRYSYYEENPRARTSVLRNKSIWTDKVLAIIQDLAAKGFEWTTLGRALVVRPPKDESRDRARARLVPEHLPGGISVIKDGESAATRVFVTNQTDDNPGMTVSVGRSKAEQVCGRLDMLVRDNPRVEVETPQQEQARKDAISKRRDQREDAASDKFDKSSKGARDRYDAKQDARRAAANRELKRIAALPDSTCNRKCKDDASDDERDARDKDIQGYRKTRDAEIDGYRKIRDKEVQNARVLYDQELAASNAAIQKRVDDETRKIMTALARQTLSGRWPVPVVITVQDGARLSSEAPITVEDLVPGERIDVAATGFCRPVAQAMRLATVSGSWSGSTEQIRISLTPLTPPPTEV
ncbi:hypothetical protein AB0A05_27435 [Streptomyces sp. NPDC046374]|uniref:hypothetical protein n=1 Tax=Streptomyces sp. NPDC046374 TaxID=3154917 RepID=UPI0033ED9900